LSDAERIVDACPPQRQLAMFSATVSTAVQALIKNRFQTAEVVQSKGSNKTVATLKTVNRMVDGGKRLPLLEQVLSEKVSGGTLMFANTREQCDTLASEVKKLGASCTIYRGEMDKVERRKNLELFRQGKIAILISTDLASRGLDIEHVARVVKFCRTRRGQARRARHACQAQVPAGARLAQDIVGPRQYAHSGRRCVGSGSAADYSPEMYRAKCAAVFEHVYEAYPSAGRAGA
jgi:ATP-dependent helicase YprA (DUF1998 family)